MAHRGAVDVESYTVMYGADGPTIGARRLSCCPTVGARGATAAMRDVLDAMTHEEFCGRPAQLDGAELDLVRVGSA